MSKQDSENRSAVLETSAGYLSGAPNTKENSMSPLDLLKINVNDHTEKKNGLTYLSWAWAWAEALKADPTANFEVKHFDYGGNTVPFMSMNMTAMVWVTVTMFGKPMTCFLPVMDHRNKPIMEPDSFQINTAIMRCMVKGLALHGLGLYIYAGEDLPDDGQSGQAEPVIVKVVTPTATADLEVNTGNADANAELFAEGMMTYTNHCTDVKGLNSYWKSNQTQLDSLKVSRPDLYDQIRNRFAEIKKQLSESK
jgi:hypothetical protein